MVRLVAQAVWVIQGDNRTVSGWAGGTCGGQIPYKTKASHLHTAFTSTLSLHIYKLPSHLRSAFTSTNCLPICTRSSYLNVAFTSKHCLHIYALLSHLHTAFIFTLCLQNYTFPSHLHITFTSRHCIHIYTLPSHIHTAFTYTYCIHIYTRFLYLYTPIFISIHCLHIFILPLIYILSSKPHLSGAPSFLFQFLRLRCPFLFLPHSLILLSSPNFTC